MPAQTRLSLGETPGDGSTSKLKSIEALRRGIEVLEAVRASQGMSLHALHQSTALSKATLLRILKTLEEAGVVQRRIADGIYLPRAGGPPMQEQRRDHLRLTELAAPLLRALHEQLPWPSDLAVRDGTRMLVLESNRPLVGLTVNRKVVGFHPHMLLSALGRAYLAFCPEGEREALLAELLAAPCGSAKGVGHRRQQIDRVIAATRVQGFAVRDASHLGPDADMAARFCAIAVPVRVGPQVAACLSCVWLADVATQEQIVAKYLGPLLSTAARMGERLLALRG
jgi:IclR family mhp operon transcriptional activator